MGSSIYSNLSPTAHKLKLQLDDDQLTNCMRCGFCLPACPTYAQTGIEAESPRGRIALMKAVADGIMKPDQVFEQQMNHCLGCRACEPACPADVKYGQLLEQARDAIEDHTQSHRWWIRMVRFLAFKVFFPQQRRMRILGMLLSVYQQSGLQYLIRKSGMMQLLPAHMRDMEKILPQASMRGVIQHIGEYHPAVGKKIATVALFRGCIMDVCFTQTNIHTVKLLQIAGFEVWIPREQSCCGALHAHSGEAEGARALARHNVRVFQEAGVDYVVSNAGGCGAILVEYDHLLHKETAWKEQAKSFAKKVIDISELLVRHGRSLPFQEAHQRGDAQIRITIQDSCHLRNVMKSSQAPRELIRQIPDVQLIEMKEADRCCGSAGIYNLTQPDMANQILDHKMTHTLATQAHTVITCNPGCLLQMKLGVKRNEDHGQESPHMKVEHIVDFMYDYLHRKPSSE